MKLAAIFQHSAVLQREIPIPVWGTASPGAKISVQLGEQTVAATTGADGRWITRLPAFPAGGPFTLQVTSDGFTITLNDLLIGDVWICSGQSNMEYRLTQVDPEGLQSQEVALPNLRLLTLGTPSSAPLQTEVQGRWNACSPESIAKFSAVGGWFGRTLQQELGVPIGLIANAWGGTRIQSWLSREALMSDPSGRDEIAAYEPLLYGSQPMPTLSYASADEWFRACGPEDPANLGVRDSWHAAQFDDSHWPTMELPRRWQDAGHNHSGIFWFRKRLEIPCEWQGLELVLNLGSIDKHDETYWNGVKVGEMGWENPNAWCTPRSYPISAELNSGSEVLLAVRVRSHMYHGGLTGPVPAMKLHPVGAPELAISLAGIWKFQVEQNWGLVSPPMLDQRGPGGPNAPYSMFASRLHPLIPYGIRGVIWYQGESNVGEAELYRRLLPLMISDWRRVWGQGNFPFLQVQLANYQSPQAYPGESDWARLRDAQSAALRHPNVGLAVAIDVGEAQDIHPKDKKTVGVRLARWAFSRVYGLGGSPSGPLLRGVERMGARLRLSFDYASGLKTTDGGPVKHIAIAGKDRGFLWAESKIVGETLEVWHPEILTPAAARYAWADNPEGCNLCNGEGLPTVPFDTDTLGK